MRRLVSALLVLLPGAHAAFAQGAGTEGPIPYASSAFVGTTSGAPLIGDICIGPVTTGQVCYDERGGPQGQTVTTDVAPATVIVNGVDAAAAAATNKTGGALVLAGGCQTLTIAIDDYTLCATDSVTLRIDQTATSRTAGTHWTAATSNAATCVSLASAIDALSGVGATCSSSTVLITCDTTTSTVYLTESDATCTTVSANTAGGIQARSTITFYDTMGTGTAAIGGWAGSVPQMTGTWNFANGLNVGTTQSITLGADGVFKIVYVGGANNDPQITMNGASSPLYIVDTNDTSTNWGHTVSSPTVQIQSLDQTQVDDYVRFYHDQTNGHVGAGNGYLRVFGGSGVWISGEARGTIAADDTTPDITGATAWVTSANSGATAITDLDNPTVGQRVTICGGSATNSSTIADSGNFNLSAAFTAGLDDCIELLVQADNDYIELTRVNN